MRRLHPKRKAWLLRRSAARARQRLPEKLKGRATIGYRVPRKLAYSRLPVFSLELPDELSLTTNYDETLLFFTRLRRSIKERRRARLEFTTLRKLSPAASLMLAAELDRWRRLFAVKPRVIDYDNWDPDVRRMLQEMGLFELLSVGNPPLTEPGPKDPRLIRFRSDDRAVGDHAIELRKQLEHLAGPIGSRSQLFRGLSEAMTNVLRHAYPKDGKYELSVLPNRWWMSGSVDPGTRTLRAMFFDQGVGIPSTLPRTKGIELLRGFMADLGLIDDDASRIKAAMQMGRSRTGRPHRGKGLPDMCDLIDSVQRGSLRIVSGKGEYIYNGSGLEQLQTHKRSIGGTLIQWEIELEGT